MKEIEKTITVFALNTSKIEDASAQIDIHSFGNSRMIYRSELTGSDLSAINTLENQNAVKPEFVPLEQSSSGIYTVQLKKASWNVLRFSLD